MPRKKIDEYRLVVRMTKAEDRQIVKSARAAGFKSKARFMVLSSMNVVRDLSPSERALREQAGMDLHGAARTLNQLLRRIHGGDSVLEEQLLDTLAAVERAAKVVTRSYRTNDDGLEVHGALDTPDEFFLSTRTEK